MTCPVIHKMLTLPAFRICLASFYSVTATVAIICFLIDFDEHTFHAIPWHTVIIVNLPDRLTIITQFYLRSIKSTNNTLLIIIFSRALFNAI